MSLETIFYTGDDQQVSWHGIGLNEGELFQSFMTEEVAARLNDEEGTHELETHLRSLANTGFAENHLNEILAAKIPAERDWAVGEAIAEAYLTRRSNVTWPWNMERDKRTPKASLPGADLIGFEVNGPVVRLVLGEVKTSSDLNAPPGVMCGKSGMEHQIENLASNLGLIFQIIKWLLHRCKGTEYQSSFDAAIALFLSSGNSSVALFGVLLRDTIPNELDLLTRGHNLASCLQPPTTCQLFALYLPCPIVDLPARAVGDEAS